MRARTEMLDEIRYAERLCERTTRLYKNVQVAGTLATFVAASAVMSKLSNIAPPWLSVFGGIALVVFGGLMLAVSPATKAAANEADMRRYQRLQTEAVGMDDAALEKALQKARENNTQEVESLRMVAYNDVVREIGREDQAQKLSAAQRLLAVMA